MWAVPGITGCKGSGGNCLLLDGGEGSGAIWASSLLGPPPFPKWRKPPFRTKGLPALLFKFTTALPKISVIRFSKSSPVGSFHVPKELQAEHSQPFRQALSAEILESKAWPPQPPLGT